MVTSSPGRTDRFSPGARLLAFVAVVALATTLPTVGAITGDAATGRPLGTAAVPLPDQLDPATPIDFGLILRMPDPLAIDAYLAGLYDPGSRIYRQFLTARDFGARFGLPLERIAGVEAWASGAGLAVLGAFDQRTVVRLRATAGKISDLFAVRLGTFLDPTTGVVFHSPLDGVTLPEAISDAVVGLTGLDNRPAWPRSLHAAVPQPADVPVSGLGPSDLAKAYDIVPLYQAGYLGDGQAMAIVSFDTFTASDIATFDRQFGIDGPAVERVAVGPPLEGPGRGAAEVTLDIEIARAVAPHAQILNFEAANGAGFTHGDMIDAIVQDGRADIISDSWGLCDVDEHFRAFDSRERQLRSMQAAAAAGVSIFVASGDTGAFDCWSRDRSDHRETVGFPTDSPFVISVGGTVLSVRADGTYLAEVGWEQYLSTRGTGGGLNPSEARPVWQRGPGVDNATSNGRRQLPDVAAAAGPDSPYQIYFTPSEGTAPWTAISGTSAAAPFWAGVAVLIRQVAQQQGVGRPGYLNPILYDLANGDRAGIFHDVTRGGNLLRSATPGWDYATGWGSPDVTALANAIIAWLRDHPASP